MPTYEYRCGACNHELEEFQSITAAPLKKCPKCGKSKLKRLIGIGAGIIFKGSGFYETDYRSDGYKKAAKADKEGASGTPAKSDSTATPAAKSDSSAAAASTKSETSTAKAESSTPKSSPKPDTGKSAAKSPSK